MIYAIIEVLRTADLDETVEQTNMREQLLEELREAIVDGELPAVFLFQQALNVAGDKSSTTPNKNILLPNVFFGFILRLLDLAFFLLSCSILTIFSSFLHGNQNNSIELLAVMSDFPVKNGRFSLKSWIAF